MEYFELIKGVFVFQNALKDPKKTYSIIKQSQIEPHELFTPWGEEEFPWDKSTMDLYDERSPESEQGQFLKEIREVFEKCFSIYKEKHVDMQYLTSLGIHPNYNIPITKEEALTAGGWGSADVLIIDYGNRVFENGYVNGYHIDRTPFWGASSHAFTLNIYPHDDFDGGGLYFVDMTTAEKKISSKGVEYYIVDKPTYYEPKAGEALLFPSAMPHGVNQVTNGEKLFIRLFMEAPRPNTYYKDIVGMTDEEIEKRSAESRAECIAKSRHQVHIHTDEQGVDNSGTESLKLIFR